MLLILLSVDLQTELQVSNEVQAVLQCLTESYK